MIKIESLKNYIEENEFMDLAIKIYNITDFLCEDYPNHKEWYFQKQLPETLSEKRNILFIRNPKNQNEIISIACLKKTEKEKKICTLFVSEKYRNLGIGSLIVEECMKWLETTKPLITLPSSKLKQFEPIINKYNWELVDIAENYYNNHSNELCYNGSLIKNNRIELQKKLIKVLNYKIHKLESNK